jgi:hypothetical protein
VSNPVPDQFWPGKPQTADIEIYSYLFPEQAKFTKAGTAPSMFGGFYYDSGFLGLIVGALLVGILARLLFEYLRANPGSAGVRLLYAASLPLFVILLRGNPTDTFARASYLVLPIVVGLWFASARLGGSPSRRYPVRSGLAPRSS